MQSHYEINVSKDGNHLFATNERSAVTEMQAKPLCKVIKEKFPESEGYKVTISHYEISGRPVKGF